MNPVMIKHEKSPKGVVNDRVERSAPRGRSRSPGPLGTEELIVRRDAAVFVIDTLFGEHLGVVEHDAEHRSCDAGDQVVGVLQPRAARGEQHGLVLLGEEGRELRTRTERLIQDDHPVGVVLEVNEADVAQRHPVRGGSTPEDVAQQRISDLIIDCLCGNGHGHK